MPRFSFGQSSSDYGGFFADLFARNEAQAKQDAADAKAKTDAEQAAADQDAYDRWQNGIMTDDEWLAYIDQRVAGTTSDPKAHEHWTELKRQYSRSIADNQAKTAFDAGGSINDYIAYQQSVLKSMTPGSQAYRERQVQLNQLIDQRSQQDASSKSASILAGIPSGKYTYKDLLKVYQDALKTAKPGTDFYNQLTDAVSKTQQQITQGEIDGKTTEAEYLFNAGKISGAEAGRRIRAVAGQYYKGDPGKYYALLESALKFEKAGGVAGGGASGGSSSGGRRSSGGGSRSSGGTSSRTTSAKTLQGMINSDKAAINRIKYLEDRYQEKGPGAVVEDPLTHQPVKLTTQFITQLHSDGVGLYTHLYQVQERKGVSTASTVSGMNSYLTKYIYPDNTAAAEPKVKAYLTWATKALAATQNELDPAARQQAVQEIALRGQSLLKTLTMGNRNGPEQSSTPLPAQDQVDPQLVNELVSFTQITQTAATNPNLTPADVAAMQAQLKGNKYIDPKWALTVAQAGQAGLKDQQALANGQASIVVDGNGKWTIAENTTVLQPTIGPDGAQRIVPVTGVDPSKLGIPEGAKPVKALIDYNGKPMQVTAWETPLGSDKAFYKAWTVVDRFTDENGVVHRAGDLIESDFIDKNPGVFSTWAQQGKIALQPESLGLTTIILPGYTDRGQTVPTKTFMRDPQTGRLYDGSLPIKWASIRDDGSIAIKDGKPVLNWEGLSHVTGVSLAYNGTHPKDVQDQVNSGALQLPPTYKRDINGEIVVDQSGNPVPADLNDTSKDYFDPGTRLFTNGDPLDTLQRQDANNKAQKLLDAQQAGRQAAMQAFAEVQQRPQDVGNILASIGIGAEGQKMADLIGQGRSVGGSFSGPPAANGVPIPKPVPGPAPIAPAPANVEASVPLPSEASGPAISPRLPAPTLPVLNPRKPAPAPAPVIKAGQGAGTTGNTPNVEASASLPAPSKTKPKSTPTPTPIRSGPMRQA